MKKRITVIIIFVFAAVFCITLFLLSVPQYPETKPDVVPAVKMNNRTYNLLGSEKDSHGRYAVDENEVGEFYATGVFTIDAYRKEKVQVFNSLKYNFNAVKIIKHNGAFRQIELVSYEPTEKLSVESFLNDFGIFGSDDIVSVGIFNWDTREPQNSFSDRDITDHFYQTMLKIKTIEKVFTAKEYCDLALPGSTTYFIKNKYNYVIYFDYYPSEKIIYAYGQLYETEQFSPPDMSKNKE